MDYVKPPIITQSYSHSKNGGSDRKTRLLPSCVQKQWVFKNKSTKTILNTAQTIQHLIFDKIMNTNTTAVIYARVSSQTDRQDTTRQVTDLEKYAKANDMTIVKTYEEHISGAKKLEEREILTQCLDYCKNNSVKYLLISELSRLGRSTLQVLRSLEILHEAKVCVYIQNIGLYSLQPDGAVNPIASIIITILAEMSNIERSNIQYRLNSGRQQYINRGGKLGRRKGSVKTVEQRKEEYREVISLLKRGYSIRNVARLAGYSIQTIQSVKNQFVKEQR
jgi:DNA invertase Pin-like site-specific DNA recombinase